MILCLCATREQAFLLAGCPQERVHGVIEEAHEHETAELTVSLCAVSEEAVVDIPCKIEVAAHILDNLGIREDT
jgi:hypothetical protein